MNLEDQLNEFCNKLKKQADRKKELYDGYNNSIENKVDSSYTMIFLIEELGEIASAIIRERPEAARAECIDLAHCAFLLYTILKQGLTENNN